MQIYIIAPYTSCTNQAAPMSLLQSLYSCLHRLEAHGDELDAMQRRHSSNTDGMPPERFGRNHALHFEQCFCFMHHPAGLSVAVQPEGVRLNMQDGSGHV